MTPPAVLRARFAALAEAGLSPQEVARMTDRQIDLVYAHPRDRHGRLKVEETLPAAPLAGGTLEADLAALQAAAAEVGLSRENVEEVSAQLRARYGEHRANPR